MGQNGPEDGENGEPIEPNQGKDETEYSFYSDDSFEYVAFKPDLVEHSRFKNIRGVHIPLLNFEGLPEYETTDEEDEGEEDESTIEANDPVECENEMAK